MMRPCPAIRILPWICAAFILFADCCVFCRDGTTSTVLLIGELMKQAERYLNEGLHPRIIVDVSLHTAKPMPKSSFVTLIAHTLPHIQLPLLVVLPASN